MERDVMYARDLKTVRLWNKKNFTMYIGSASVDSVNACIFWDKTRREIRKSVYYIIFYVSIFNVCEFYTAVSLQWRDSIADDEVRVRSTKLSIRILAGPEMIGKHWYCWDNNWRDELRESRKLPRAAQWKFSLDTALIGLIEYILRYLVIAFL